MSTESIERAKQQMLESAQTYVKDIAENVPESPRVRVAAMAVMTVLEVFRREGIEPSEVLAEFPRSADRRKAN